MNNAPYFATILSTFFGSLSLLSNLAEVKPYTELIAVLRAFATALALAFTSSGLTPSNISSIIGPSLLIASL